MPALFFQNMTKIKVPIQGQKSFFLEIRVYATEKKMQEAIKRDIVPFPFGRIDNLMALTDTSKPRMRKAWLQGCTFQNRS